MSKLENFERRMEYYFVGYVTLFREVAIIENIFELIQKKKVFNMNNSRIINIRIAYFQCKSKTCYALKEKPILYA